MESNNQKVIQVSNIKDLEQVCQQLQRGADESMEAALAANIQVLKFVSSPELIASNYDLIFANIGKALKSSRNEFEKNQIRERGTVMIHNMMFFMNAKLKFAQDRNKEEARQLLADGSKMLANSVTQLMSASPAGASMKVVLASTVTNFFQVDNSGGGFFERVISWWNKEQDNENKEREFNTSLQLLFEKLERFKNMIGKSDMISGMIDTYRDRLASFNTEHHRWNLIYYDQKITSCFRKMKLTLIISAVIYAILWVFRGIGSMFGSLFSWVSGNTQEVQDSNFNLYYWGIVAAIMVYYLIRFLIFKVKYNKENKKYNENYNAHHAYYANLSKQFHEEY